MLHALLTGCATKDLHGLHSDLNAGLNVWRLQQPILQGFIALALSLPIPSGLVPMLEGYYLSGADPVAGGLIALGYALTD